MSSDEEDFKDSDDSESDTAEGESDASGSEAGDAPAEQEEGNQGLDPLLLTAKLADHAFDVVLHPTAPLIATSLVTGQVEIHRYDDEEGTSERKTLVQAHRDSCRTLRYTSDGDTLISASVAKTINGLNSEGRSVWEKKIGESANALCVVNEKQFAVGDDAGKIHVFDMRQPDPCFTMHEHEEYVGDMTMAPDGKTMLSVGGDGKLAVWNMWRKGKLIAMSDQVEDEFLNVVVMKDGKKVCCGQASGAIAIFSWGDFGDMNDRIVGVPSSVDAMGKLSEDTLITGSHDGALRIVSMFPNKVRGILGEHTCVSTARAEPIEKLVVTPDKRLAATLAHDHTVKIWSLADAHKVDQGQETVVCQRNMRQNFFADM